MYSTQCVQCHLFGMCVYSICMYVCMYLWILMYLFNIYRCTKIMGLLDRLHLCACVASHSQPCTGFKRPRVLLRQLSLIRTQFQVLLWATSGESWRYDNHVMYYKHFTSHNRKRPVPPQPLTHTDTLLLSYQPPRLGSSGLPSLGWRCEGELWETEDVERGTTSSVQPSLFLSSYSFIYSLFVLLFFSFYAISFHHSLNSTLFSFFF